MWEEVENVLTSDGEASPPTVVVLGLGAIGMAVSRSLVDGGYVVHGMDRSVEARDRAAQHGVLTEVPWASPAGAGIDMLICCLPGPSEVVEALLSPPTGPLTLLAPGARVIDMTTNSTSIGGELAKRCADLGLTFVDAPVSEMPPNMVVMAGCDGSDSVVAQMFAHVARHVVYLGAPLSGYAAKLLHQYVFLSSLLASAESIRATRMLAAGTDEFIAIAAAGSAYSKALTLFPGIEATGRVRRSSAPLRLLFKDVTLIKEFDDEFGLGLRGIDALEQAFRSAMEELGEDAPLYRLVDAVGKKGDRSPA